MVYRERKKNEKIWIIHIYEEKYKIENYYKKCLLELDKKVYSLFFFKLFIMLFNLRIMLFKINCTIKNAHKK